jgi:hypothetical protein
MRVPPHRVIRRPPRRWVVTRNDRELLMKDLAGKFGGALVWLFALIAIGLTWVLGKVGVGGWAGLAAAFAIFALCAWAGAFMTKAGVGMTILAVFVATIGVVVLFYFQAASMVVGAAKSAATAAATGGGAAAAVESASSAVGFFGFLMGAWKILVGALGGGIAGAIFGGKMKSGLAEAPAARKAA